MSHSYGTSPVPYFIWTEGKTAKPYLSLPRRTHSGNGFGKRQSIRSQLMTKDMTFQHVSWTLSFPGKHVVGVFGSLQEAEQAVQALVDAGYHVEDMALIPSQDFPSAFQEHLRKEGRFL